MILAWTAVPVITSTALAAQKTAHVRAAARDRANAPDYRARRAVRQRGRPGGAHR